MARTVKILQQLCATGLRYGVVSTAIFMTTGISTSAAFKSMVNYLRRYLDAESLNEVIFFPDSLTIKKQGSLHCSGMCSQSRLTTSSEEKSALEKILHYLSTAKISIDVCMFTVSCSELADAIIKKHKEGICVRVITDNEQIELHCSQIDKFRREGIQVRNDRSSFLMHHKFAIIDSKILLSGSLNWTRQALVGNKENIIISNNANLVTSFMREFGKLWEEYDMEPRTKGSQTSGTDLRPTVLPVS